MIIIDGSTASRAGKSYCMFDVSVEAQEGRTTALSYTIWLPVEDTRHATRLDVPTSKAIVATTPRIPGLEVHIPAGVSLRTEHGHALTSLSLTPVPVDRPPFPLPEGTQLFFTPQAHGAKVESVTGDQEAGIRIIFPNIGGLAAGSRVDLLTYDASDKGWHAYGQGTVSEDGRQVVPDREVVIRQFMCLQILGSTGDAPSEGPPYPGRTGGDPVDLATGLFLLSQTDIALPDVIPIAPVRTYRPQDSKSRAFGIGSTHSYQMFLVGDTTNYSYAELILPTGGRIKYDRISAGTSHLTAVMEHTSTPSEFYKSRLSYDSTYVGWELKFLDGTIWRFKVFHLAQGHPSLQSIRDRNGNELTIVRQSSKIIDRIISPHGRWIEFSYDSSNRITQITDNTGRTVNYTYDSTGRLWKVTNQIGEVTEYTYDSSHRMLTIKDARGIVYLTNQYDANGRVSLQTQTDGSTYQFAYTLDSNGKVTQTNVTNPRGNVHRLTFNNKGYVLTDTLAQGTSIEQTYTYTRQSGSHLVQSITDPLGRRTDFAYNSMGDVTSVTRLAGTSEAVSDSFTYESTFNLLTSTTNPLGQTFTFAHDSNGNVTSVTNALGHQSSLTYNSVGQAVTATDPLGNTSQFSYNGSDLAATTNPLGHTASIFTDAAGRTLRATGPLGQTAGYEYDSLNRSTRITDPMEGATQFAYDPNGNLLSVTDARNNSISSVYDNMDRVTTRRDSLLRETIYEYNTGGLVKKVTDRKGQTTQFTYDALDRLTQATYADGSTITYNYDAGNRVTQIVDSVSGTISFTYDNLDRVTGETTAAGTVSYTYDALGRRTSLSVPGQTTINYTYDNGNRLTQITQGTATVSFTYDNGGRLTSQTLPNGVVSEYGYDAGSRLTAITYKKSGVSVGNLSYEYDAAGRRIRVGGSFARTGLPQPINATSYNAANHQLTFGSQSLVYDLEGNLTSDGVNTYTWNARNQMVSMSGPGISASFLYDAVGRRISKTINSATTAFLYDGANIVQEKVGGAVSANLLVGGLDNLLTRSDSSCNCSALKDAVGSTVALADTSGTVQTEYSYEPFGKTTASGATSSNPSKYTGREDDGAGLYYYRARYYSPSLQRFISEDPIGIAGGINLYAYVGNNPISFNDPMGLKPSDPWISEAGFCYFLGVCGTAAAGFGDMISGGLTDDAREWTGANGAVDKNHGAYTGGQYAAYAWGAAFATTSFAIAWEWAAGSALGAGAVSATGGGGFQVALWLAPGLAEFAKQTGSRWYLQWPGARTGPFDQALFTRMMDRADKIHFNLRGLDPSKFVEWAKAGAQFSQTNHVTNWELHQIVNNPAWLSKTIFYGYR